MNLKAVKALYFNELKRAKRTIGQTVLSPVISTSLYFVIFGSALGARIQEVEGISYASFIVPGLMMLTVLNQSVTGASFSLYLPRLTGAIYEVLCAPLSYFEIALAYIAAATTRAMVVGLIILGTSRLFIPFDIAHPSIMLLLLLLTCVTFSMLGFIIGLWADSFEKIEIVPRLIITPLSFLGGSFYSIDMLSPLWQKISMFNPVVYLISAFRWSFFEHADVPLATSLIAISVFLLFGMVIIRWIFTTGYRLKS